MISAIIDDIRSCCGSSFLDKHFKKNIMYNSREKDMKHGLVMQGGAMRGLFTAGVIDVLMENNIAFDAAVGVSAGAAFGCNYKSGTTCRARTAPSGSTAGFSAWAPRPSSTTARSRWPASSSCTRR